MVKNQSLIIQIAALAAALLVGTALGRWTSGETAKPATAQATTSAPAGGSTWKSGVTAQEAEATTKSEEKTETAATTVHTRKSLSEIFKNRNAGTRTKELEEFAKEISASEIGAALKQLRKMPDGTMRDLAEHLLAAKWVESDPEGALKFASENREFDYLASDVMQQMAASDLQGALAKAQSITDPNARYQALRGVLSFMADTDPMGALQLAGTLGQFPNQEESLAQMIYRQWGTTDPQAAALRAMQDPQGDGWRSPVGQVLRTWAGQDPTAALAWISNSNPADLGRDVGQVMRRWSRDDLPAAANWANSQPAGAMRDAAAAALAYSLGGSDPNGALQWAQSISDPGQRDQTLQRLARQIMYTNPANGAQILAAAGVPQNMIPQPNQGPGGRGPGGRGGGGRRGP